MMSAFIAFMMISAGLAHEGEIPPLNGYSLTAGSSNVTDVYARGQFQTDHLYVSGGGYVGETGYASAGFTAANLYIGGAYLIEPSDLSGTRWQIEVGSDLRIYKRLYVSVRHLSNCTGTCGNDRPPNDGFDSIGLTFRF